MARCHNHCRYAIIDLGSNTFHLLISDLETETGTFTEVFRKRSFVYLSQGGVQLLSNSSRQRAISSLKLLGALCKAYEVDDIQVFGTAVFRSATNASDIHEAALKYLDSEIRILSGEEEADYILKGISWSLESTTEPYLVMDIGGGSVEYILVNRDKVVRCSLNHGISVLRNEWSRADPPTGIELNTLSHRLNQDFVDKESYIVQKPRFLVGSSGPFEILESMLQSSLVTTEEVIPCMNRILSSTLPERMELDKMPQSRADLSIESMAIVLNSLNNFTSIDSIRISPYGIKEGFIRERLNLD